MSLSHRSLRARQLLRFYRSSHLDAIKFITDQDIAFANCIKNATTEIEGEAQWPRQWATKQRSILAFLSYWRRIQDSEPTHTRINGAESAWLCFFLYLIVVVGVFMFMFLLHNGICKRWDLFSSSGLLAEAIKLPRPQLYRH